MAKLSISRAGVTAMALFCVHVFATPQASAPSISIGRGGDFITLSDAINKIPNLTQRSILFLPGQHTVCDFAPENGTQISGAGADSSVLVCRNRTQSVFVIHNKHDVQIADISFAGRAKSGLHVRHSQGIQIDHAAFTGNLTTGLKIDHSQLSILNSQFRLVKGGQAIDALHSQTRIHNNGFLSGTNQVSIHGGTSHIQDNIFQGVETRLGVLNLVDTHDVNVLENTVEYNANHGITLTGLDDSNAVGYNRIVGNRGNGIVSHTSNVTVLHNTVIGNGHRLPCPDCVDIYTDGQPLLSANVYDTIMQQPESQATRTLSKR